MTEFEPSSSPPPPAQHITVLEERRPRRGSAIFWGFLGGCVTLFVLLTIVAAVVSFWGSDDKISAWQAGAKNAVIPIDGEILEPREFIDALHRYRDQSGIRAIVVRINSPGGAVVPSQEILEEIRKVRKDSGKPVVASMDSVAASGGYYIAVGCDRIVANPGTITGSIGVIAQWFNIEGLIRWAKMKPETLTSGPMKDAGSPYRDLSPEERAYLQNIVTQLHQQFVQAVTEGRTGKLSKGDVERLADGRVYTGEEAHRLKLVDDLGNLQDAVQIAANLAGVRGTPRVLYPRPKRPGLIDLFSDSESERVLRRISSGAYNFLYRWY